MNDPRSKPAKVSIFSILVFSERSAYPSLMDDACVERTTEGAGTVASPLVQQPPRCRPHGQILRCCDQPALFSRELSGSELVHVPVEAVELGIVCSGALGTSGEPLKGKNVDMPVNMLVWQARGVEDDVGVGCAGKVRAHGSPKFRKCSAQQAQGSSDTVSLGSPSRSRPSTMRRCGRKARQGRING